MMMTIKNLDKTEMKQLKRAIVVIADVLDNHTGFTGCIRLNFLDGGLLRVNIEYSIKVQGETNG